MSNAQPRVPRIPGAQSARPILSLIEAEAVAERRLALRHWRDKKTDLARLERDPMTSRGALAHARNGEIDAARACRNAGAALDAVLLGDE